MLDMKYDCIPPNKDVLIVLFICAGGSAALAIMGYRGNPPIAVDPRILLCISIVGIYSYAKTVEFSEAAVKVRYFLYMRTIPWARVKGIEFVCRKSKQYIFICLEDCAFWSETNVGIGFYMMMHPRKLISIRINGDQRTKYKEMSQKYCSNVFSTGWE